MNCCGQIIKKAMVIAEGKVSALAEKLFKVEIVKCDKYDLRMSICRGCNKQTHLTNTEYAKWLIENGKDVVKNFNELETLPPLPKMPERENTNMCCRMCKCYLDAKCRVKTEQCPIGRWFSSKP